MDGRSERGKALPFASLVIYVLSTSPPASTVPLLLLQKRPLLNVGPSVVTYSSVGRSVRGVGGRRPTRLDLSALRRRRAGQHKQRSIDRYADEVMTWV